MRAVGGDEEDEVSRSCSEEASGVEASEVTRLRANWTVSSPACHPRAPSPTLSPTNVTSPPVILTLRKTATDGEDEGEEEYEGAEGEHEHKVGEEEVGEGEEAGSTVSVAVAQ